MNARSLATVLLRTWSIIAIVQAVVAIPQAVALSWAVTAGGGDPAAVRSAGIAQIVGTALLFILATGLFAGARSLTAYIVAEENLPSVQDETLQQVAFGTLGAYMLVLGLRQIGGLAFEWYARPVYESDQFAYLWRTVPQNVVQSAVQIVAGAALLAGRRGLSRSVQRIRGRSGEATPGA